jgi:hypothetical protein
LGKTVIAVKSTFIPEEFFMQRIYVSILVCVIAITTIAHADTTATIFNEFRSPSPTEKEWTFDVSPFSVEHQVRLSLDARIDWPNLAGSNPWLRVAVNGNFLTKDQLLNKRNDFKVQSGVDLTWVRGDRWRVLYSPNFEDAIKNKTDPMAAPNDDPYHFVWDITPFVKPGENVLKIYNLDVLPQPTTMVLANARVEVGKAIAPPPVEIITPAPTGPLPTFVATGKSRALAEKVLLAKDGGLTLQMAGKYFSISTSTSLPDGKWYETAMDNSSQNDQLLKDGQSGTANWTTAQYAVNRQVKVLSDHVHISDTFTNRTAQLIGVIIRHHLKYPATPTSLLLAGRSAQPATPSAYEIAENPSVFAQWPELGLGLIAEDDVFRVHIKSYNDSDGMGLADEQLGITPNSSVTLEWDIYPTPKNATRAGDYWDFVNAVRRNWGSNYTIPGPFAFLPRFDASKPASWFADWLRSRGEKIVTGGIAKFADGKYAHGTGILSAPEFVAHEREIVDKIHQAAPDVKYLAYFHAQACTEPDADTKYSDSYLLNDKGEHIGYPYSYPIPLFLPTRENSYGKALWKVVHNDLDKMDVDGLYWDEMTHSVLQYAKPGPWDNHTVIIDPQTHAVLGKRTSVPLVMQPLQVEISNYLREHGKVLIANTQPMTQTMLNEHIVRFVECQSYQSLLNTHFGCPIGLGNHFPEENQADTARHIRDMLQYGAVYYADTIHQEKPPTWPFVSVMFPITPVELRAGMVLGKERIQTAVSGNFGWPDGAAADVYVIDGNGNRVTSPQVKDVGKDGRHLYEIRMPSDHFAVLVKR